MPRKQLDHAVRNPSPHQLGPCDRATWTSGRSPTDSAKIVVDRSKRHYTLGYKEHEMYHRAQKTLGQTGHEPPHFWAFIWNLKFLLHEMTFHDPFERIENVMRYNGEMWSRHGKFRVQKESEQNARRRRFSHPVRSTSGSLQFALRNRHRARHGSVSVLAYCVSPGRRIGTSKVAKLSTFRRALAYSGAAVCVLTAMIPPTDFCCCHDV